jgi:hypothetical protein
VATGVLWWRESCWGAAEAGGTADGGLGSVVGRSSLDKFSTIFSQGSSQLQESGVGGEREGGGDGVPACAPAFGCCISTGLHMPPIPGYV